jgi:GNAT superfamily N-acetyltransferase
MPSLTDVFRRASWSNEGDRQLLTQHPEFLELDSAPIRNGRTRVAVCGGVVVGFASIELRGEAFELIDLFVDPDHRRSGIGRALVEDLVTIAIGAGVTRIDVDGNHHALDFYRAVDFSEVGEVRLAHGTAIRMSRPVPR